MLDAISMKAALSLEPLLALLGTLARDLQADYMPHIPKVVALLTSLVDGGGLFPACLQKRPLQSGTKDSGCCSHLYHVESEQKLQLDPQQELQVLSQAAHWQVAPSDCSAGAHAEPEILQHIFECLALICKHLIKQLAADLPQLLRTTARLRHHQADHVRRLAASTLAYLFRHATSMQLRTGVRTVLAGPPLAPFCDCDPSTSTLQQQGSGPASEF